MVAKEDVARRGALHSPPVFLICGVVRLKNIAPNFGLFMCRKDSISKAQVFPAPALPPEITMSAGDFKQFV